MINIKYAYFFANVVFFLFFLFIYISRKDLRKQMLQTGVFGIIAGPLSEIWYFKDYWQPDLAFEFLGVAIEDMLFGFTVAGLGSVLFEYVFKKRDYKKFKKISRWQISTLLLTGALIVIILTNIYGMNSIYSSMIAFMVIAIIMLIQRRDLYLNSLANGLLGAFLAFITYQVVFVLINPEIIDKWWLVENLSGILIFDVPIEEMGWGFAWGLLIGPFYEFTFGLKQTDVKS